MTPGPVQVRENVRNARSIKTTNPDVDTSFVEEYKETCDKIAKILHTSGNVYILSGEGILGLECACASLTEKGDRVLVIDNGIFMGMDLRILYPFMEEILFFIKKIIAIPLM